MKTIVISLGGSLILSDKNPKFLNNFKRTLRKHYKTHKFVIVCGGGSVARKYISMLKKDNKSKKELSLAGIRATRANAETIMQLFGKESNQKLPITMKSIKSNLKENNVVISGALRYTKDSKSDTTAANLAKFLNTKVINITNVKGLYTENPLTNKKAKFISKISWTDFESRALKIKHTPGQHFVLDQKASTIIRKNKITTYIIGPNLNSLSNILKGKKFVGTIITK